MLIVIIWGFMCARPCRSRVYHAPALLLHKIGQNAFTFVMLKRLIVYDICIGVNKCYRGRAIESPTNVI